MSKVSSCESSLPSLRSLRCLLLSFSMLSLFAAQGAQGQKAQETGAPTSPPARKKEGSSEPTNSMLSNLVSNLGFGGHAKPRVALPSLAPMVEKLLPAVVNISTQQTVLRRGLEILQFPPHSFLEQGIPDYFDGARLPSQPQKRTSLGSGFIIDSEGHIVTNNHVIADADEITVTLADKTVLKAKIVGRDHRTDLALLKIDAPYKLPAVEWGDSLKARAGDWVVAVGNPLGFGGTVTAGIISARARDISGTQAGGAADYVDDFIQTDASINVGNSGGPMFDMNGQVIGINTAILSPNGMNIGINFAVPESVARPVIEQLKEYGRTKRGWIGVHIQRVSPDVAENIGLGNPRGALVGRVSPEGPAAKAGLKTWDVIVKFDGVSVLDPRKLTRMVGDTPVGKTVEITVWRNQKEEQLTLTVGQLEDPDDSTSSPSQNVAPKQHTLDTLGLVVSTLTPEIRSQLDLRHDTEGVLVIDIKPNSSAASKRMRPDDIIVEVDRKPTRTIEELNAVVNEAVKDKKKSVLIQFSRDDQLGFEALKLDADKSQLGESQKGG